MLRDLTFHRGVVLGGLTPIWCASDISSIYRLNSWTRHHTQIRRKVCEPLFEQECQWCHWGGFCLCWSWQDVKLFEFLYCVSNLRSILYGPYGKFAAGTVIHRYFYTAKRCWCFMRTNGWRTLLQAYLGWLFPSVRCVLLAKAARGCPLALPHPWWCS